jgi:cytochrome c oxidase assembly protein subunit 15
MMQAPSVSPRRARQLAIASLVFLFLIVLSGASVRLTGSGLACPSVPECSNAVVPHTSASWIEFSNRVVSAAAGFFCIAVFIAFLLRDPRERKLLWLAAAPPIGVLLQGILGAITVYSGLKPGFVLSHFLLSYAILIAATALVWRSGHERGWRPESTDRVVVWGTRALFPLVTFLVFLGTLSTAAGPHPGSSATGEVVERLDWFGMDTLRILLHDHGHLGTAVLVYTLLLLIVAWRRKASRRLLARIGAFAVVFSLQGVVGLLQYYNGLPTGLVWIHISLATSCWLLMLFCVLEAGRLVPRTSESPARSTPGPSPA